MTLPGIAASAARGSFSALLMCALPSLAMELEDYPAFQWPPGLVQPQSKVGGADCPPIGGVYDARGESWVGRCGAGQCAELQRAAQQTMDPVPLHPRFLSNRAAVEHLGPVPAALVAKGRAFQIVQRDASEYTAVQPYLDGSRADYRVFERASGDYTCSNGTYRLPPFSVPLGRERSSYDGGKRRIAVTRLADGSIAYVVYTRLTYRALLAPVPIDTPETLQIVNFRRIASD